MTKNEVGMRSLNKFLVHEWLIWLAEATPKGIILAGYPYYYKNYINTLIGEGALEDYTHVTGESGYQLTEKGWELYYREKALRVLCQ